MAVLDRFAATIVSRYGNQTLNNIVYGQILDEALPDAALDGFAALVRDQVVVNLAKCVVDVYSVDAILVRRLKPAITDVELLDVNANGDLPQDGLPGTCFILLRYFCTPYEKGSAFHWKFAGLPEDANKRGVVTAEHVTRFTDLIEAITGGPYASEGNQYSFTRAPKSTDAPALALPTIYKAQVDNTIRNLRSRQVRL